MSTDKCAISKSTQLLTRIWVKLLLLCGESRCQSDEEEEKELRTLRLTMENSELRAKLVEAEN